MTDYAPITVNELVEIVQQMAAAKSAVEVLGNGTKRSIGRPSTAGHFVSTRALTGVIFHAPEEMVIRVRAGTTLAEVQAVLAQHHQHLAFEPPALQFQGTQTIGGVIGCNLSGSRRISQGAARDSVIGVEFVNGKGELIKSGGRVMKNVTGYDFSKLLTGSYGTLGILTEITLKVLPKPSDSLTLSFTNLDEPQAIALLCKAMGSPYEVTGAACVGRNAYVRLEGLREFITLRVQALQSHLAEFGAGQVIAHEASLTMWQGMNTLQLLPVMPILWCVSLAPTKAPVVMAQLKASLGVELSYFYDWSGGRVWCAMPLLTIAQAAQIRMIVGAAGGHATLYEASDDVRRAIAPFHPQADGVETISHKIKAAFDPINIFNPNRMN